MKSGRLSTPASIPCKKTVPEREVELEQSEIEKREHTNLRVLEWMHNLEIDERVVQNIQQVGVSAINM